MIIWIVSMMSLMSLPGWQNWFSRIGLSINMHSIILEHNSLEITFLAISCRVIGVWVSWAFPSFWMSTIFPLRRKSGALPLFLISLPNFVMRCEEGGIELEEGGGGSREARCGVGVQFFQHWLELFFLNISFEDWGSHLRVEVKVWGLPALLLCFFV